MEEVNHFFFQKKMEAIKRNEHTQTEVEYIIILFIILEGEILARTNILEFWVAYLTIQ